MARIFTTPASEQAAKVLMHDITVAGGLNTKNLRTNSPSIYTRPSYIGAAQAICNEIVDRNFDNIDQPIKEITRYYHKPNYDGSGKNKSSRQKLWLRSLFGSQISWGYIGMTLFVRLMKSMSLKRLI